MTQTYCFADFDKDTMARATGKSLTISFKHSIEISNYLRGKKVEDAQKILSGTIDQKHAIPFKRFSGDVGHKPGKMAAGRYPVKASTEFLSIINAAKANAQFKGLNANDLKIIHINVNKGPKIMRYGRQGSRASKRTHIEVVVQETEKKAPAKKAEAKAVEKKTAQPAVKPEAAVAKKPATPVAEKKETPVAKKEAAPVAEKKEQPKAQSQPEQKPAQEKPAATEPTVVSEIKEKKDDSQK